MPRRPSVRHHACFKRYYARGQAILEAGVNGKTVDTRAAAVYNLHAGVVSHVGSGLLQAAIVMVGHAVSLRLGIDQPSEDEPQTECLTGVNGEDCSKAVYD